MNQIETQKLKALIVATAAYYGQQIPDQVLAMYVEDLADLNFEAVVAIVREIRRDPKNNRFPLPAVIRDRISPAITPENEALEAVSRIIEAVSKIGPYRVAAAREYVGELAWSVVQTEGSWENVCSNLTDDTIGVSRAQWKQIALAKLNRAKAGITAAPGLPAPIVAQLDRLGVPQLFKQIPAPEGQS